MHLHAVEHRSTCLSSRNANVHDLQEQFTEIARWPTLKTGTYNSTSADYTTACSNWSHCSESPRHSHINVQCQADAQYPKSFNIHKEALWSTSVVKLVTVPKPFPLVTTAWQQAGPSMESAMRQNKTSTVRCNRTQPQLWGEGCTQPQLRGVTVPNPSCEVRGGELRLSNPYWYSPNVNAKYPFFEENEKRYKSSSNWTSKTCFGAIPGMSGLVKSTF